MPHANASSARAASGTCSSTSLANKPPPTANTPTPITPTSTPCHSPPPQSPPSPSKPPNAPHARSQLNWQSFRKSPTPSSSAPGSVDFSLRHKFHAAKAPNAWPYRDLVLFDLVRTSVHPVAPYYSSPLPLPRPNNCHLERSEGSQRFIPCTQRATCNQHL